MLGASPPLEYSPSSLSQTFLIFSSSLKPIEATEIWEVVVTSFQTLDQLGLESGSQSIMPRPCCFSSLAPSTDFAREESRMLGK